MSTPVSTHPGTALAPHSVCPGPRAARTRRSRTSATAPGHPARCSAVCSSPLKARTPDTFPAARPLRAAPSGPGARPAHPATGGKGLRAKPAPRRCPSGPHLPPRKDLPA